MKKENLSKLVNLIFKYIDFSIDKLNILIKLEEQIQNYPRELVPSEIKLIKKKAFVTEANIKSEDLNKKRNGQYLKYKSIPKWHHYAWDMIK